VEQLEAIYYATVELEDSSEDSLIFIPRFELCLPESVISECIESSIQCLGYNSPSKEQFEAIYNFI